MAQWAILNWIRKNNTRSKIWAILPTDSLSVLPKIDEQGYWEEFRQIVAERYPDYAEAKVAIDEDGFYFTREATAIGALNGPPTKG